LTGRDPSFDHAAPQKTSGDLGTAIANSAKSAVTGAAVRALKRFGRALGLGLNDPKRMDAASDDILPLSSFPSPMEKISTKKDITPTSVRPSSYPSGRAGKSPQKPSPSKTVHCATPTRRKSASGVSPAFVAAAIDKAFKSRPPSQPSPYATPQTTGTVARLNSIDSLAPSTPRLAVGLPRTSQWRAPIAPKSEPIKPCANGAGSAVTSRTDSDEDFLGVDLDAVGAQ
jgi:hypothetical protein